MSLYILDPLNDTRWDELVASHPGASVFHRTGWLKALSTTYGYRPLAVTSTGPGSRLADGIAFCEVKSRLTGCRLVSLPFSDHAQPLSPNREAPQGFADWITSEFRLRHWRYIELRPLVWETCSTGALVPSQSFWCHSLDLTPPSAKIFSSMHKDCMQRRIRRAEREALSYEKGCSETLLLDFYRLLILTRKRHHVLPQPFAWFRNLAASMETDLEIRLARKDGVAIAAILTLRHGRTVVYKYGCSDERFHPLAAMPFLFWKLIEESKTAGAEQIDLGRTDLVNEGLIEFKNRLGAARRRIVYFRFPESAAGTRSGRSLPPAVSQLFSLMPGTLSSLAGSMVYRHLG